MQSAKHPPVSVMQTLVNLVDKVTQVYQEHGIDPEQCPELMQAKHVIECRYTNDGH